MLPSCNDVRADTHSAESILMGLAAFGALTLTSARSVAAADKDPTIDDDLLALAIDVFEESLISLASIPTPDTPDNPDVNEAFLASVFDQYEQVIFPGVFSIVDFKIAFNHEMSEGLVSIPLTGFFRAKAEQIATEEIAIKRLKLKVAPVRVSQFNEAADLVRFAETLIPAIAIFRNAAAQIVGTGRIHNRLIKLLWNIVDDIASNLPQASNIYKKIFDGLHGAAHGTAPVGDYEIKGGGKLVNSGAVSIVRIDISGRGFSDGEGSVLDTSDIDVTLSAFNYPTRTLIESDFFSLVRINRDPHGNFLTTGKGIAQINQTVKTIILDASKTNEVFEVEIRDGDNGDRLAGGIGVRDRFSLQLTIS